MTDRPSNIDNDLSRGEIKGLIQIKVAFRKHTDFSRRPYTDRWARIYDYGYKVMLSDGTHHTISQDGAIDLVLDWLGVEDPITECESLQALHTLMAGVESA